MTNRYKKKAAVPAAVSDYLSQIGSVGGNNGSLEDKSKAGRSKSRKKTAAARKNAAVARRAKLEKHLARLDGLGHGSEPKK